MFDLFLIDRVRAPLIKLVRAAFPRLMYYGLVRAKVTGQSSDLLRVDVVPDPDPWTGRVILPPMSDVPLRHGLPAFKVQLDLTQVPYVLVGFMFGASDMPYVHSWEQGEAIQSMTIAAGTKAAARVDDQVNIGSFNILGGVGNAMSGIQWIPPGGGSPVNFSVSMTPPPTEVTGKVKTGSTKVSIG